MAVVVEEIRHARALGVYRAISPVGRSLGGEWKLYDLHQQRAKWPERCFADESLSLLKERALWRVAAITCPIFGVWWTNRTRSLRGRCSLPRLNQYRPRAKWQRRYSADEILWLGKNVFSGGRNPVVASGGVTVADTACRMFRSHDHG